MRLNLSGLNELRERLERLRSEEVMARALAEQAARMAARVRDGLSERPGAAGHDEPWLQSGALRDSVGAQADGLQAVVGSSDPAAAPQELGTTHIPARPFLAPVAAAMGEEVARAVGGRRAAALRGDGPGAGAADEQSLDAIQVSSTPSDTGFALLTLGAVALGWALGSKSSSPGLPTTSGPTISEAAVSVPSPAEGEKPLDVLKPGGQNVGAPGETLAFACCREVRMKLANCLTA